MSLTNEDLLAISDLMDMKLNPIKNELSAIPNLIDRKLQPIKYDLSAIPNLINRKLQPIKNDLSAIPNLIDRKLQPIENDLLATSNSIQSIKNEIKMIRDILENNVIPKLSTIESCYLSTFERYAANTVIMEFQQADVEILKKVVIEHSEKLHKIS